MDQTADSTGCRNTVFVDRLETLVKRLGRCFPSQRLAWSAVQGRCNGENPYRLARDIRGIGFRTADVIAERLGIEKTAMIRVRAGISFALSETMGEGHCGLPVDELVALSEKLLEGPPTLIATAVDLELTEGTVTADSVGETACVFLIPAPAEADSRWGFPKP